MQKRLVIVLVMMFVFMITGCGNSNSAEEPIEADSQIMENVEQRDTVESTASENIDDAATSSETQEPNKEDWEDICEKADVNLVEKESESRIVVQRNVRKMEMNLTVYLADGTSGTIRYPMFTEKDYAYCETAYLQYDNKESIVLEIVNGTSNYGAAEYHVLHVEKENGDPVIIEDATILGEQPLTGDRYVYSLIGFVGNVSLIRVEELITTIYGKPAVCFVDWDSNKKDDDSPYETVTIQIMHSQRNLASIVIRDSR